MKQTHETGSPAFPAIPVHSIQFGPFSIREIPQAPTSFVSLPSGLHFRTDLQCNQLYWNQWHMIATKYFMPALEDRNPQWFWTLHVFSQITGDYYLDLKCVKMCWILFTTVQHEQEIEMPTIEWSNKLADSLVFIKDSRSAPRTFRHSERSKDDFRWPLWPL